MRTSMPPSQGKTPVSSASTVSDEDPGDTFAIPCGQDAGKVGAAKMNDRASKGNAKSAMMKGVDALA